MSKKAKRVAAPVPRNWTAKGKPGKPKRRATALDHAKCMWNNTQALLDQAEAKIAVLNGETTDAAGRIAELEQRLSSSRSNNESQRGSIRQLKAIIAGLEKDVARQEGIIATLGNQIDQAADKVMVQPAVMMSPQEARRMRGQPDRHHGGGVFDGLTRMSTDTAAQPKHWSDL